MKANPVAAQPKTKPIKASFSWPHRPKQGQKETNCPGHVLISGMGRSLDSDSGAAIEKLCRGAVVDKCSRNDKAACIGGGADFVDREVLDACPAVPAQRIIACAKRNGFDNSAGNSFSHSTTPVDTIVAESSGQVKENPAGIVSRTSAVHAEAWQRLEKCDVIGQGAILWWEIIQSAGRISRRD